MNDGLGEALTLLRSGQQARAEQVCRQVAEAEPGNFGASHLLGVILLLRGEPAQAERQIARAIALDPDVAGAHYNHGNALLALGRAQEAIASYDRALALKPDMAEALCNRGNAQSGLGQLEPAIASYRAAIASNPRIAAAHNNLGKALIALGRPGEALASFDAALAHEPADAATLNNRGSALLALDRLDQALASYDRAIEADRGFAEAFNNRGIVLQALDRHEEAIASHDRAIALAPSLARAYSQRSNAYRVTRRFEQALRDCDKAIALQPGFAEAFNMRGVVHHDMGRFEAARADYDKAARLDEGFAEAFNNLGNVLHDLGRSQEALQRFVQSIALRPDYAEAFNNRGMVLQDCRRFEEARGAYDRAIVLKPVYAEAHKRRATLALLQGDFRNGWKDYETSLHQAARHGESRLQSVPYWAGEPLQGKSIMLSEPSGLGDTIQFLRYLPAVIAMGARVSFLGPGRLFRLLRTFPHPVQFLSRIGAEDHFDFRCELWSLPHLFASELGSIPGGVPYLAAEPDKIAEWSALAPAGHFNIGLCWQGNPDRKIDIGRSIPLAAFAPLGQVPGVRLVSLQKQFGLDQLDSLPAGMSVVDPGPSFDAGADAFVDSAGLMMGLDLVVSADTSIAHLAGALGRPTWLGLKHVPEWRWLLDRTDSPWYPTIRLFRQRSRGDWAGVFEAMADALRKIVD